MVHFSKRFNKFFQVAIAFAISGIISGITPPLLFLPGLFFGCAILIGYRFIYQRISDKLLMAPLVCWIIFFLTFLLTPMLFKNINDLEVMTKWPLFMVGYDFNLVYLEYAFVGSIMLGGYLWYIGINFKFILLTVITGTLMGIAFFDYMKVGSVLYEKIYPFLVWHMSTGWAVFSGLINSRIMPTQKIEHD